MAGGTFGGVSSSTRTGAGRAGYQCPGSDSEAPPAGPGTAPGATEDHSVATATRATHSAARHYSTVGNDHPSPPQNMDHTFALHGVMVCHHSMEGSDGLLTQQHAIIRALHGLSARMAHRAITPSMD